MLLKVKKLIASKQESDETFDQFYLDYMKRVQDKNIDREFRNKLKFSIFQLSHLDKQVEADYRKLVNDQNAKFN